MKIDEETQIVLAARTLIYELMHSVLGAEPSKELIDIAAGETLAEAYSVLATKSIGLCSEAYRAWRSAVD